MTLNYLTEPELSREEVNLQIALGRRSWVCMGRCPQCRDKNREPSLIRKRTKEEFRYELQLEGLSHG